MERIIYADYLRVIGILGVMGVHLCGNYLSQTPLFSSLWYQGTLFYSITRSGVLLFVLVSGLLLLDRPQSIDRLPHRIERVMLPFIFWLFINRIFSHFYVIIAKIIPCKFIYFISFPLIAISPAPGPVRDRAANRPSLSLPQLGMIKITAAWLTAGCGSVLISNDQN